MQSVNKLCYIHVNFCFKYCLYCTKFFFDSYNPLHDYNIINFYFIITTFLLNIPSFLWIVSKIINLVRVIQTHVNLKDNVNIGVDLSAYSCSFSYPTYFIQYRYVCGVFSSVSDCRHKMYIWASYTVLFNVIDIRKNNIAFTHTLQILNIWINIFFYTYGSELIIKLYQREAILCRIIYFLTFWITIALRIPYHH